MNQSNLHKNKSGSLIGTASSAEIFILLETPQPWVKPALLSDGIPESLRQFIKSLLGTVSGIQVHLIANEHTVARFQRRILIFQRNCFSPTAKLDQEFDTQLTGGYVAWETQVETPEEMTSALRKFWDGLTKNKQEHQQWYHPEYQHLMICTHANHNECCGLYGYPFYQMAIAHIKKLELFCQVSPWQISHIGGHRFAPTLIDFPQGRCYGNLDETSLLCLLEQNTEISPLISAYRGWSLLPKPLQILEGELFRQHGRDWLRGQVAGKVIKRDEECQQAWVELHFQSAEQQRLHYTAEIHKDEIHHFQLTR